MPPRKSTKSAKDGAKGLAEAVGKMQFDTFMNQMARTGFGTPNLMEGTQYVMTRLTRNYNLMNTLYRNSWVARRIIDTIPQDMTKAWTRLESDLTPEDLTRIERAERATRVKRSILSALKWGRLYGGAAAVMMIDGQEEDLEAPLDIDSVNPGDFKGLMVLDRWSGIQPQPGEITDISNPEFGLPEFYQIHNKAGNEIFKVHHSRLLRFTGDDLPEWERQTETFWGASVIESVYEELKKRDNTSANIAGLIFLSNLRILKMSDLGELLSGTGSQAQKDFYDTIQAQSWLQSNFGMYVMSKDDDFQTSQASFSGLHEVYESFMLDLSGATQIPVTKLFGRSPAGLNATGDSDLQNYYDVIQQNQEAHLRPALEKLFPVLCMSSIGFIPDEYQIEFNPINTPGEKEAADIVKAKTESVLGAYDRGLISDRTALLELKQMSDGTGIFTNITDDDINKADAEPQKPLLSALEPDVTPQENQDEV